MIRRIDKAAVIGSGIMGGGIAALLADAGVETLLLDIVPFNLTDEEKKNPAARNKIVQAGLDGLIKAKPALLMDKASTGRIKIGNLEDDFKKLADCDLIIEVVVENLKIKQDLFGRIDKVRKPSAIVATNTSGLPLKEISKGLSKEFKQNFMGTHFFNPVRYMHLLELIPGESTSKEVLEFVAKFGETRLGKGVVWAKDTPNFIGNRIGVYSIVDMFPMMKQHGMSIAEVDAIFGPAMGRPKTAVFKLSDMVGLDTINHLADNSYELLPSDERRDAYKVPAWFKKLIENKWLGDKTKQGFYKKERTPEGKKLTKVIDPETLEYKEFAKVEYPCLAAAKAAKTLSEKLRAVVYANDKAGKFAWEVTASGCIYAANRVPEIADTILEIDNAMTWGYNNELGPFGTWDAIGLKESVEKMEKEGKKVPANIKKMLSSGATSFYKTENGKEMYYDLVNGGYKEIKRSVNAISLKSLRDNKKVVKENSSVSLIDIGDGVFCVEYHTKMNAVNGEMVDFFPVAQEYVSKNGVGIVIGNQAGGFPGAFSAGGDLAFMLGLARAGKFNEIDSFIKNVHTAMQAIRYSTFPIVTAPYGMTLGGGCEICLASSRIVAHAETYMGLVEIGAGLLPGGLGMLNLWRKMLAAIPKPVKISDMASIFLPVMMNAAQAKVAMGAADARGLGFLGQQDRIVFNRDLLIGEAKKEVLKMIEDGYAPPIKAPIPVMGQEAMGMIQANFNDMKIAGYITPHMGFAAMKIAQIISGGGDVIQGTQISEEQWMKQEREAFVDLWKTENSQKMAEHMMTKGKPLMI